MLDFPPISKEVLPEVRVTYVYDHCKNTREIIKYSDISDTMYGGSLPIASKKRKFKKATSEVFEGEASKPMPKKARKEKAAQQVKQVGPEMQTT